MHKELDVFSEEVTRLFPEVVRAMSHRQTNALDRGMITLPQFLTVNLLVLQGSLRMKDVAVRLGVSLPAVTGIIDRLCRLGLVQRLTDKGDRRVVVVEATVLGKKIHRKIIAQRKKTVKCVFGKLSVRERSAYLRILRKLHGILYGEEV